MDANQIEKLKALALAATKRRSVSEEIASLYDFQGAANPAAVLELIAEVERLRAAPAAGTVEKDAERYQLMRAQLSGGDLDYYRLEGQSDEEIDAYCDTEIVAHTKAGKDSA